MQLAPEFQSLLFGFSSSEMECDSQINSIVGTSTSKETNSLFLDNKVYSENALSFFKRKRTDALQTGVEPFDQVIGEMKLGGTIVELYGNEGQGITQTCYTAMCHIAMPSHFKTLQFSGDEKTKPREGCQVLYFDLDDKFEKPRFIEIVEMNIYKAFYDMKRKSGEMIDFSSISEEMIVEEIFDASEISYNSFVLEVLSRIHIFRVDNSFQLALAFEALHRRHNESNMMREKQLMENEDLSAERESLKDNFQNLEQLNSYKCIVVNSLSQYYKPHNAYDRKNWERSVELLIKLTNSKQVLTLACVYDIFSKTSRQKYHQKRNTTFYQGANRNFNDDRLATELVQLYRDELKFATWSQNVHYRLLFGGEHPDGKEGVKYCHLQNLKASNRQTGYNPSLAPHQQSYKDLYKMQILDYGILFFK
ncbi:predicted protein [Naegleria gruberi]|uniref:Predicted protein n=1 Tax=Naegleria gruberi TaxID=5762 RepID=D2VMD2_NAEGR|nr:uncharacterized protein NAEGRDRAFT_70092 [Naegleria gruberi]EFC42043.1 predicted protein [Naegleria gruberi]|eukprot:XP_002674787.1 predicted protein [Naegleria gruberi strain NEG-M]